MLVVLLTSDLFKCSCIRIKSTKNVENKNELLGLRKGCEEIL